MSNFIHDIDSLDENGQRLRYSEQRNGDLSQEEFLWVDEKEILNNTKKITENIDLIISK